MNALAKWLGNIVSEDDDGKIPDLWRLAPAVVVLVMCITAILIVWIKHELDFVQFGSGVGIILGGAGAGKMAVAKGEK